jgi:CRP-like cAMP-binding protein
MHHLLTDDERAHLAAMASIVRFKKGEIIYRETDRADAVFNIISGIVSAYKKTPDGSEHMVALLLPDDLFGRSAEGRYTNSTKAITALSAYRLPLSTPIDARASLTGLSSEIADKLQLHHLISSQGRYGASTRSRLTMTRTGNPGRIVIVG